MRSKPSIQRVASSKSIPNSSASFLLILSSAGQVARLKKDSGVYMVDSSRINVAGITPGNVDYLADSIAAVL